MQSVKLLGRAALQLPLQVLSVMLQGLQLRLLLLHCMREVCRQLLVLPLAAAGSLQGGLQLTALICCRRELLLQLGRLTFTLLQVHDR